MDSSAVRYGNGGTHGRRVTELEDVPIGVVSKGLGSLFGRGGRKAMAPVKHASGVHPPDFDFGPGHGPAPSLDSIGSKTRKAPGPQSWAESKQDRDNRVLGAAAKARRNPKSGHVVQSNGMIANRPSGEQQLDDHLDFLRRAQAGRSSRGHDPISRSTSPFGKAARYYDPEHKRQRRLGAYESGLAGGGLAAAGAGGVRATRDSKELRNTVIHSNPNPNAKKVTIRDLPKGKGKGALRVTRGNAALLAGGTAALAGAGLVRQKAEGRKFGIWR